MRASGEQRLTGRVAIVTGSGNGIGRATALLMAAQGARVVVNDMAVDAGVERAASVVEEIRLAGGEAVASTDDISSFEPARRLIGFAVESFGRLHILVNNAGRRAANTVEDMTEDEFDLVVDSHLKGTFATIKYATPIFLRQRSGVILNTGSEAGLGQPFNAAYAAAKEGVAGLTRSVARELGRFGVRCNQVRPRAQGTGSMETATRFQRWKSEIDRLGRYRLGRRGEFIASTAAQVASLSVWLCTDAAADVNGRDFFVAGDQIARFSEPDTVSTLFHAGGWDLDLLDKYGADTLLSGLTNEFAIDYHPSATGISGLAESFLGRSE